MKNACSGAAYDQSVSRQQEEAMWSQIHASAQVDLFLTLIYCAYLV